MAARKEPSHVIQTLGIDDELANSVIRVSIGHSTSDEDCERFAEGYIATAQKMLG